MNDETRENQPESTSPAYQPPPGPQAQQPGPAAAAPQPSYAPGTPPQQSPPARRNYIVPVAIGGGCLLLVISFFMLMAAFAFLVSGDGGRGGNLAIIRVTGAITGGKSSAGVFGGSSAGAEDLVSQLEKARKDDDIKAIVVRINSPGGSAAGSEEVWNEIMRVRRSKPVYASMGDVAASGGYYVASACDRIYADGSTVTGSIGVIFAGADMSELYRKIGFRPETVKSGKYKDIGSPARPLTADERALLQTMINDIYNRFVNAVAEGRKLPVAQVRKIADGRVLTGDQALRAKLVDRIGGLHEAIRAAARAGGIEGEPDVVEYERKGILGSFLGEDVSSEIERAVAREVVESVLRENALPGSLR